MAELAYAQDLKSWVRKELRVRLPLPAPNYMENESFEQSEARIIHGNTGWYGFRRSVEIVTGFNLYRYGWRFFFRQDGCEWKINMFNHTTYMRLWARRRRLKGQCTSCGEISLKFSRCIECRIRENKLLSRRRKKKRYAKNRT